MTMEVKDLCRLCAKKDIVSKDLLHEDNKELLKLTQEFIQIVVYDNDNLPSKICINCEEKMVSFQLFVLECYEVQEILRKTVLGSIDSTVIKTEEAIANYIPADIKSEVKLEVNREEFSAEEIDDTHRDVPSKYEDCTDDDQHDDPNYDDNDDYLSDDVSIAVLKHKKDTVKTRVPTNEDLNKLQELMVKGVFKVKNLVHLQCTACDLTMPTWTSLSFHCYKIHKSKPTAFCLCGFAIKSKSVLYKHYNAHKLASKKAKDSMQKENEESSEYSNIKVHDYINFICSECDKQFSSWYTLKSHCEKKHQILPLVKCKCGVTLKSKSVMYKHVADHKNPDMLRCDKCPRITKTLSALNKHKMRHVPKSERKFCCSRCEKIFTTKEALKSHERSHIPVEERKVFQCDLCDLMFTTRSSVSSHRRVVHDKIKGYVCDLCGYACGTNGELRQHRAIHSDDKPFACKICSKSFKTYSNLKTHEDTHETTSYQCHKCRRVLNSRRTLRKHLLVHQEECRHVCSYCNKAFKRRQTLKVHMHTHTGDKPLSCQWCSERFSYASTLRSHRLRCHPDKMAARPPHNNYAVFPHASIQQNYGKNELSTSISVAKNELEPL